jgi:hypothetical protein
MAHGTMDTLEAVDGAPDGIDVRRADWGEQLVMFGSVRKGFDMSARLVGLQDDACQVPHWGYCLTGSFRVRYTDGTDETIGAGEAFYLPPGHVPEYLEDCRFIEFTPAGQADEQRAKMQALSANT